jgi:hypothetical protein
MKTEMWNNIILSVVMYPTLDPATRFGVRETNSFN